MSKRKEAKYIFLSADLNPYRYNPHMTFGTCPQPGVLKIGKFLFGEKEHKIGSKMHLKSKKSRSENFCRIERTLENTGFSRAPLAKNRNFDRNPSRGCNFDLEGGAVLDLRGCIVFSMPSGSIL